MDTKAIRVVRMRELIDKRFNKKQADFAEAIERQPDYISRCLKGKKGVGEDFARYIEDKLNLPPLWMDSEKSIEKAEEEQFVLDHYWSLSSDDARQRWRLAFFTIERPVSDRRIEDAFGPVPKIDRRVERVPFEADRRKK